MKRASVAFLVPLAGALACVVRYSAPTERAHDARFGFLAGDPRTLDVHAACTHWDDVVGPLDEHATSHTSFPEIDADRSCFTPITHAGRTVVVGRTPPGCAVPNDAERDAMRAVAERLDGDSPTRSEPLYPCSLNPDQRAAADRHNASVLRQVAALPAAYPYSAIVVPGFGNATQARTSIASWLPGEACHGFADGDRLLLGSMVPRTRRASDAWQGGAAPMVLVTGGSPHSSMIEAFAMLYLLTCDASAEAPLVLVEPCAEHTHTNLRNAARWLVAIGARTGYLVTDDAFQADYFQDWTGIDLIGGSVDARSLRDWGYVIGSWRQASVGIEAGFWFTPYRFWAEPRDGLGGFTCVTSDGR
jgi:hypothetical protein